MNYEFGGRRNNEVYRVMKRDIKMIECRSSHIHPSSFILHHSSFVSSFILHLLSLCLLCNTFFFFPLWTSSANAQEDKSISPITSPANLMAKPETRHSIRVAGGLPPYRWFSKMGMVREINPHLFEYTAPRRYGKDRITFEDRAGQRAEVKIMIPRPLAVSPARMTLAVNETGTLSVFGGSGDWEVLDKGGLVILDKTEDCLTLQAGPESGEVSLIIKDRLTSDIQVVKIIVYDSITIESGSKN